MIVWRSSSHASSEAPLEVARVLHDAGAPGLLLCDSGRARDGAATRSFLHIHPDHILTGSAGAFVERAPGQPDRPIPDPIGWLRAQGPWTLAGLLGFEIAWTLDPPDAPHPRPDTPDLWVGRYLCGAAFDHATAIWEVFGPAEHPARAALLAAIHAAMGSPRDLDERPRTPPPIAAPDADAYRAGAAACVAAITAGEVFEINYTARWSAPWARSGFTLYERLRAQATGELFGFVDAGEFSLASVSPERLLSVRDGVVTASPIKGSRRRSDDPVEDAAQAAALLGSAKDRAENVMIVDLMRNDLTRVCVPGTVAVPALCALESFAGIHHLVSTITGRLDPGCTPMDALLVSAPAGSITGAPKLRSIELIRALEHTPRGLYTGSLFRWSGDTLDSSVLIRSATIQGGLVRYGAGGAIVSDSDPEAEWQEAQLKLWPLLRALGA
jgi:para-aminobenzoate synthetase component I